jgi:hypothetical protein
MAVFDFSGKTNGITANVQTDELLGYDHPDHVTTLSAVFGPYSATDFFDFIGTTEGDTFVGGDGGNKFTGGGGSDNLTGGLGKDLFYYESAESVGDIISGDGGKKDAIVLTNEFVFPVVDFTPAAIAGIERVIFEENGGAVFDTAQIGKGKIKEFVGADNGSTAPGFLTFFMFSQQTFDLNSLTFINWDGQDELTFTIHGGLGDDTIVAHEKFGARIDGGDGADDITGSKRDDLFGLGAGDLAPGESIKGMGGDNDSIYTFGGGAYDFTKAKLTGVERIFADSPTFEGDYLFKGSQIGAKGITTIDLLNGAQVDVVITGKKIDLRPLGLGNWNEAEDTLTINGTAGNDTLIAWPQVDATFVGGAGRDLMTGSMFAVDTFLYEQASDSGINGKTRDRINKFETGIDILDVADIDADGNGLNGDTSFAFLLNEGDAFTGAGAEVRWRHIDAEKNRDDKTIIEFDIDGNQLADFTIELARLKNLAAGDFDL